MWIHLAWSPRRKLGKALASDQQVARASRSGRREVACDVRARGSSEIQDGYARGLVIGDDRKLVLCIL